MATRFLDSQGEFEILNDEYFGSLALCLIFSFAEMMSHINPTDCKSIESGIFLKKMTWIWILVKQLVKSWSLSKKRLRDIVFSRFDGWHGKNRYHVHPFAI